MSLPADKRSKNAWKYNTEDPSYDPFSQRVTKYPTSDIDTFVHLFKAVLGTGILAMPFAFMNCGLFFGLLATPILGFIITYCIHMLISCSHILCHRLKVPKMDYADVAEQAFLNCNCNWTQHCASKLRKLVKTFLIVDLSGCCIIYLIFAAKALKQALEYYYDLEYSLRWYIFMLTLPLMILCLVRNLKFLVPFSLFANIALLLGIIISCMYILTDMPATSERVAVAHVFKWPLFTGTLFFAMECVGLVMSLENEMKTPTHMIGCPSVLSIALIFVVLLYTFVGFFGYLKYGEETKGSVTLNLPMEDALSQIVKAVIGLSIFFTFLLTFYVPVKTLWQDVGSRVSEKKRNWLEYALREMMVLFCAAIAIALPNLGPLISLIGSVCESVLGVILPMTIELAVYHAEPGYGFMKWRLWKCIFLITFGVFTLIAGAIESIQSIKEELISKSFEH